MMEIKEEWQNRDNMKPWEILRHERERIKDKYLELMNEMIKKQSKKKQHKSKHAIPISTLQRMAYKFIKHVDDINYY